MSDDKKPDSNEANDPQEKNGDDWAKALEEQVDSDNDAENVNGEKDEWSEALTDQNKEEKESNVKSAQLQSLEDEGSNIVASDQLDVILDIPVTISMEVGRTLLSIRHLLKLNQGSVVELDRMAGEPLDVMVNGTLIAHGEVVVINDKFGIRLTDVMSQTERIKKLK